MYYSGMNANHIMLGNIASKSIIHSHTISPRHPFHWFKFILNIINELLVIGDLLVLQIQTKMK